MGRAFGAEFFSDQAAKPAWMGDADLFNRRLKPLLAALNLDVRRRVESVVDTRKMKVHSALRSMTQLGKGDSAGIRVNIRVSDYVPPPILTLLEDLPESLIWVLLHRYQLAGTAKGLRALIDDYDLVTGPKGFEPPQDLGRDDLQNAESFLHLLNSTAVQRAEEIVRSIVSYDGDVLGAYFFRRGCIELYWVPIWLVAGHLGVAPDDLAHVVLVHEMAHLYTHVGQDASNGSWEVEDFANCSVHVVEGLAQFYTETYCMQANDDGNERLLAAFHHLMDEQAPPYRAHLDWAPTHRKRAEIIRQALVEIRTLRIGGLPDFEQRIRRNQSQV